MRRTVFIILLMLRFLANTLNYKIGRIITNQFTSNALQEFASVADAYLVVTAATKGMGIVTYEKSSPNSKRCVKIPDACIAMKVDFCDLNGVFRDLEVTI